MTTDDQPPLPYCLVELVPGSRVQREPAFVPGLPVVGNGPPGTFVTFAGGRRVPLPTDRIVLAEDAAGAARVGFGGMRFVGVENGQLCFRRVRELHPEHQLSPERRRRMTLEPAMVTAVFMEGRLVWGRPRRLPDLPPVPAEGLAPDGRARGGDGGASEDAGNAGAPVGDPPPFRVERPAGKSPFLITCDHAGRRLPARLGTLGLSERDLDRHIAWDLGVAGVARQLADQLDAVAILQTYSRLAIDANRPPGSPESILATSDGTAIPGNQGISTAEAERRAREIFHPYHDRIRAELDQRLRAGRNTLLVSLHSFTPALGDGRARIWQVGVLHLRDTRLAHLLLDLLRQQPDLVVGDNEPYAASDATDYSIVEHGERRGLLHVEIELRQDLIADEPAQATWATRLAPLLRAAHQRLIPE